MAHQIVETMEERLLAFKPTTRRDHEWLWRQLSDVLAQRGDKLDTTIVHDILVRLSTLRRYVGEASRAATARDIAAHCRSAPLVAFYAHDTPIVARTMIGLARLSDDEWLALLPNTTGSVRALISARTDLSDRVKEALAVFGPAMLQLPSVPEQDYVLNTAVHAGDDADAEEDAQDANTAPRVAKPHSAPSPVPISDLVARIASHQSRKRASRPTDTSAPSRTGFRFMTDAQGTIVDADPTFRGAVIGISIAQPAYGDVAGTDAVSAGAFRHRALIQNARLQLVRGSRHVRDWRFSAQPEFEPLTGQFLGYSGFARLPENYEDARPVETTEDQVEPLRQLLHELRSPLTAISGFAQMLESQMFGPVARPYRVMASAIEQDAQDLQNVIADIYDMSRERGEADLAAEQHMEGGRHTVDLHSVVTKYAPTVGAMAHARGAHFSGVQTTGTLHPVLGRADELTRIATRLLDAIVVISGPQDHVSIVLVGTETTVDLVIARPRAIEGIPVMRLRDPGYTPEGDAPDSGVLGLGFSLRLVENLCHAAGATFKIGNDGFSVQFPAARAQSLRQQH